MMTSFQIFENAKIERIKNDIDDFCHRFDCEPLNVSITFDSTIRVYVVAVIFRKLKGGAE